MRRRSRRRGRRSDGGQLSLSLVEAGLGVVLVFAVVAAAAAGAPGAGTSVERRQLERYAGDAVTVLRAGGDPTLDGVVASADAFEAERAALRARLDELFPAGVLYRVETPHGTVGYPVPRGRAVGEAVTWTRHGRVTVVVWYA
ncbi:MAG: hypothetical protein ABEJ70_01430 [Halobacteriaceae archaeon]